MAIKSRLGADFRCFLFFVFVFFLALSVLFTIHDHSFLCPLINSLEKDNRNKNNKNRNNNVRSQDKTAIQKRSRLLYKDKIAIVKKQEC